MKLFVVFAALLAAVLVNEINGENKVTSQWLNELPLKKDIRLRKILNQLGPFVWLDSEDLIKVKRVEIFKALSNLLQLVKSLIKIVTFLYLAWAMFGNFLHT